jgi:hypothetical protein
MTNNVLKQFNTMTRYQHTVQLSRFIVWICRWEAFWQSWRHFTKVRMCHSLLLGNGIHPKIIWCTLTKATQERCHWRHSFACLSSTQVLAAGNSDVEGAAICIGKFWHCNSFKKRLFQWQRWLTILFHWLQPNSRLGPRLLCIWKCSYCRGRANVLFVTIPCALMEYGIT